MLSTILTTCGRLYRQLRTHVTTFWEKHFFCLLHFYELERLKSLPLQHIINIFILPCLQKGSQWRFFESLEAISLLLWTKCCIQTSNIGPVNPLRSECLMECILLSCGVECCNICCVVMENICLQSSINWFQNNTHTHKVIRLIIRVGVSRLLA